MSDDIPTAPSRRVPMDAPSPAEAPVAQPVDAAAAHETPLEEAAYAAGLTEPDLTDTVEEREAEAAAAQPVVAEPVVAQPAAEPVTAAPLVADPVTASATGEVAPVAPAASAVAGQQVVYVDAPIPPRVRGNRVIGSLLAVLGAVIFSVVYAVVAAFIFDFQSGDLFGPTFGSFLASAFFWIPGVVFLVGLVLLVLVLNRAGWWAHVLGSLILAFVVYFGMIGLLLLIGNVFHGSPQPVTFASLALHPLVLSAAIVAREVAIWMGLAIAARGRRVKTRNLETRTAWDREQEQKRAERAAAYNAA